MGKGGRRKGAGRKRTVQGKATDFYVRISDADVLTLERVRIREELPTRQAAARSILATLRGRSFETSGHPKRGRAEAGCDCGYCWDRREAAAARRSLRNG